ncbi:MAG: hypothetical protein K2X03_12925 [Bryobacteraceae bacterium]|nr:hypothetical protein [Bryobacteraceae bacterium]
MRLTARRLAKTCILLGWLASTIPALDKGTPFKPEPIASYEFKVKLDGVTIAAQAFHTEALAQKAFGKLNPNQYEVLPVLVIIENTRDKAIRVDQMSIQYITPGVGKIDHTPYLELLGRVGPSRPNLGPQPFPIPRRTKKNPFNQPEVEARAWAAKMIGPGETAHGFFYFQTRHTTSSRLYLTGIFEPATNKELYYYEIPFGR